MDDRTIYGMLADTVRQYGKRVAVSFKEGATYRHLTYDELWERVHALRLGMAALGVKKGDRIVLLSENRVEWALTDLAAHALGVVAVAIYPTLPAQQVEYIVADSVARL